MKKRAVASAMPYSRAKLFSSKTREGLCEWSVHVECRPIERFVSGDFVMCPENVVCIAISPAGKRPFTIALESADAYELAQDISRGYDVANGI